MFKTHRKTKNSKIRFRIITAAFCCGIFAFIIYSAYSPNTANAAISQLSVDTGGWIALDRSTVYIPDITKLSIANAVDQSNPDTEVTFMPQGTSHFTKVTKDSANHKWDSINSLSDGDPMIAYVPSSNFPANAETSYAGENVTITWKNVARYTDDTRALKNADVKMIVNNLTVKTTGSGNDGIILLADYKNTLSYFTYRSTTSQRRLGAHYDVIVRLYDSDTGQQLSGKTIGFGLADLDHCDLSLYTPIDPNTTCDEDATGDYSHIGNSYIRGDYAEGVTFIDGVSDDKVFVEPNSSLDYYGSNTRFVGKAVTDNTVPANRRSGVAAQMNANNFKYQISGFNVMTENGFIPPAAVVTDTAGDYANEISITATDNEVLWKNNKQIRMTLNPGFRLSKLIIDGVEYTNIGAITTRDLTTGDYLYDFSEVTYDHEIIAYAEPITIQLCKQDTSGNYLSGAIFTSVFGGDIRANIPLTTTLSPTGTILSSNADVNGYASEMEWSSPNQCITVAVANNGGGHAVSLDNITTTENSGINGYKLINTPIVVDLNEDGTVNAAGTTQRPELSLDGNKIIIKNELHRQLQICKRDDVGLVDPTFIGSQFRLTSSNDVTPGATLTSDNILISDKANNASVTNTYIDWYTTTFDNACVIFVDLPDNTYTLTETNPATGWSAINPVTITISNGEPTNSSAQQKTCSYSSTIDPTYNAYGSADCTSLSDQDMDLFVDYTSIKTLTITEDKIYPELTFCKDDTNGNHLSGALMQIKDAGYYSDIEHNVNIVSGTYATMRFVDPYTLEWVTAPTSCIRMTNLPDGGYNLIEVAPPDGYETATTIHFEIKDDYIISANGGTLSSDHMKLTMTDNIEADTLYVQKVLKGAGADTNKSFAMELTLTSNDSVAVPSTVPYVITHADSTTTSGTYNVGTGGKVSFSLKGDEMIAFTTNHKYDYSVSETDYRSDGYTTTYANESGTMTSSLTVTVTNYKDGTIITGIDFGAGTVAIIIAAGAMGGLTFYAVRRVKNSRKML